MDTVAVSPRFQVAIPKAIREALHLTPGTEFHVVQYGDRVELIPVKAMADLRGFARGMDTAIPRDRDRR